MLFLRARKFCRSSIRYCSSSNNVFLPHLNFKFLIQVPQIFLTHSTFYLYILCSIEEIAIACSMVAAMQRALLTSCWWTTKRICASRLYLTLPTRSHVGTGSYQLILQPFSSLQITTFRTMEPWSSSTLTTWQQSQPFFVTQRLMDLWNEKIGCA